MIGVELRREKGGEAVAPGRRLREREEDGGAGAHQLTGTQLAAKLVPGAVGQLEINDDRVRLVPLGALQRPPDRVAPEDDVPVGTASPPCTPAPGIASRSRWTPRR